MTGAEIEREPACGDGSRHATTPEERAAAWLRLGQSEFLIRAVRVTAASPAEPNEPTPASQPRRCD